MQHIIKEKSFFMDGCYIQFEGTIFNAKEIGQRLRNDGRAVGEDLESILLAAFHAYGPDMAKQLEGTFAFSIVDRQRETIWLFRDPIGVQTLYYTLQNGVLIYSSCLDKILKYPGMQAQIDREGLCELLGMGPARTPGKTPFKGIYELPPGSILKYSGRGLQIQQYWKLRTLEHHEDEEQTIERTAELLERAIITQTDAVTKSMDGKDAAVLLSGGLDSSYVAAVYQKKKNTQGKIYTYSLDFPESKEYFSPNEYQPELDRPYVDMMVRHLQSHHNYIWCGLQQQVEGLLPAMRNHDLPCMADIQSTLDYFCMEVGKEQKAILTGECADEIFGGYPWFHVPELMNQEGFAWSLDLKPRTDVLTADCNEKLHLNDYVMEQYLSACNDIAYLPNETEQDRTLRRNAYLTIQYFMQTLIRRTAVSARMAEITPLVPFADPQVVEYAYNIPWAFKKKDGVRKYILRQAAKPYLPEGVANRAKSPYPKNYHPSYMGMLMDKVKEMEEGPCPIYEFVDKKALLATEEMDRPWFGQLMKKTQMIAYYLQVNAWLVEYNVNIVL